MSSQNARRPRRLITRRRGLAVFGSVALLAVSLIAGCGGAGNAPAAAGSVEGSSSATTENAKVKVVASFYPMADFASKVGGNHVQVENLVPAGVEPHEWEPAPKDIKAIEGADLFVYNGADMEGWVADTLESVDTSKVAVVEASRGIKLREADHSHEAEGDQTEEHEHTGEHDPHVWVSPKNALHELGNIKDGLVKADPDHKADYEANYKEYAAKFEALDKEYAEKLGATKGKTIVVSHEAYGYLCDEFGLTQMPITGMDAEGEPDAQTMAQIVDFVKQHNVKVIFSEDLVSPKVAQAIADETGAKCEQLNPIEGLTDKQLKAGEDYLSVMEDNLDKLVDALNRE